jgi:hypothetical protein
MTDRAERQPPAPSRFAAGEGRESKTKEALS